MKFYSVFVKHSKCSKIEHGIRLRLTSEEHLTTRERVTELCGAALVEKSAAGEVQKVCIVAEAAIFEIEIIKKKLWLWTL